MTLCSESDKDDGREGIRIDITSYGYKVIRILKSLYEYNITNPSSFKTTNNCIGFRWEIEQLEEGESKGDNRQAKVKTYNLIIDRDFNYIYTFRKH